MDSDRNPNEIYPPRLKAKGNLSIPQFFLLIAKVVPSVYAYENEGKSLVVKFSYPDEFMSTSNTTPINLAPSFVPTITLDLLRSMPGTLNDAPFQPRRDIKPRYREVHRTPAVDGKEYIEIQGQWFDNLVELACWCKSDTEAYELCEWLGNHLEIYRGYYKEMGIQEMFYYGGGTQAISTSIRQGAAGWRNPLNVRGFTYYVRTESLWHEDYNEIKRILVSLGIEEY